MELMEATPRRLSIVKMTPRVTWLGPRGDRVEPLGAPVAGQVLMPPECSRSRACIGRPRNQVESTLGCLDCVNTVEANPVAQAATVVYDAGETNVRAAGTVSRNAATTTGRPPLTPV